MEIPVINRISEFDGVILHSLQNPSRNFPIFHRNFGFWQFGALVFLAFVAFFNRIKIFIFRFHKHLFPISYRPLIQKIDDEILFSEDDDDDVASSCTSDCGDEEENDGGLSDCDDYTVAGVLNNRFDEGEGQNCKFNIRRRRSFTGEGFSWSEFTSGKSVVKLWDGFGLGLDLNGFNRSVISLYDLGNDKKLGSFPGENCQIPAFTSTSPAVILSAGVESSRNLALKVWDARVSCQIPAIFSDWCNAGGNVVRLKSNGGHKVYLRDDGSGDLAVRDMRKVNAPLDNVKEYDEDTWWDADAVIVSHPFENDNTAAYNSDGSFCRDGVWPNLFRR